MIRKEKFVSSPDPFQKIFVPHEFIQASQNDRYDLFLLYTMAETSKAISYTRLLIFNQIRLYCEQFQRVIFNFLVMYMRRDR
jgi:hypothetical protein